jgi:hypothetical protein
MRVRFTRDRISSAENSFMFPSLQLLIRHMFLLYHVR